MNHFAIVIKHVEQGLAKYKHGRILLQDHVAYMLFIYSAQVGEYSVYNMRKGPGRGLLYQVSRLAL